jgi:hypothetical protein
VSFFVSVAIGAPCLAAPGASDLVAPRSVPRLQAVAALSESAHSVPCLTPIIQSVGADRQHALSSARRALATLVSDNALPPERAGGAGDAITVRFTSDPGASDRLLPTDANGNGRPDAVDDAMAGIAAAQKLLVDQLELPNPGPIEIVLSRLGSSVEGLSVPSTRGVKTRVWLDPSVLAGAFELRRAAEHQYAHAVAAAAGLNASWGEAFATWTAITLEHSPDDRTVALIADRFAAAGAGLVTQDPALSAGNAAWLAFLHESYGTTAVKLAVEELGRGGSDQAALDRALRRATGEGIDTALREFQLWALLVGTRDDGRHFSFADRLPAPSFASTADALPALSIQADPEIGPMGQAAILLHPDERAGGVTVRFEGDIASRWGADVLIQRTSGELRRVAIKLAADDAGELTLPLQDVADVVLLVRDLDPEGRPARRYSWAAQFEPGFPAEFGSVRAEPTEAGGVLVSWETSSERSLLGFNVVRARGDRGRAARINPVWIPSVGDAAGSAAYSFYDATAEPGISYRYRIEAVTLEGLQSRSEPVAYSPAP